MTDTRVAMAIAAHPDDIEFMIAGTLLLLKLAAYDIHMGLCGRGRRHTGAGARRARCWIDPAYEKSLAQYPVVLGRRRIECHIQSKPS